MFVCVCIEDVKRWLLKPDHLQVGDGYATLSKSVLLDIIHIYIANYHHNMNVHTCQDENDATIVSKNGKSRESMSQE